MFSKRELLLFTYWGWCRNDHSGNTIWMWIGGFRRNRTRANKWNGKIRRKKKYKKRVYLHVCMHMTRSIRIVRVQRWRIDFICVCTSIFLHTQPDWHSWWKKGKKQWKKECGRSHMCIKIVCFPILNSRVKNNMYNIEHCCCFMLDCTIFFHTNHFYRSSCTRQVTHNFWWPWVQTDVYVCVYVANFNIYG